MVRTLSIKSLVLACVLYPLAGCFPYPDEDDAVTPTNDLAGLDLTAVPQDLAGLPAEVSGKTLTGRVFALESVSFVDGPAVFVDGYPLNKSPNATNGGVVKVDIPKPALNQLGYVVIEGAITTGSSAGLNALRTIFALGPQFKFDGGTENQGHTLHFFVDDPGPTGIRTAIGRDLDAKGGIIAVGDGATSAGFGAKWNWAYGTLAKFKVDGLHEYANGVISVQDATTNNCKVFYARKYSEFKAAPAGGLINFAGTQSVFGAGIIVLCPGTLTGEVTLTSGGPVLDGTTNENVTLEPIKIPMALGSGVYFDWGPVN